MVALTRIWLPTSHPTHLAHSSPINLIHDITGTEKLFKTQAALQ